MQILQFNLEDLNPDGMTDDEIQQWLSFIGTGKRPQCAKQWFPGVRGQYANVLERRNYLVNKQAARLLRKSGSIQHALQYEANCDRIYRDFKFTAPW